MARRTARSTSGGVGDGQRGKLRHGRQGGPLDVARTRSEALGGSGRLLVVVVVGGDAGVGKIRFVAEGMLRAAADGLSSVWGPVCCWLRSCCCGGRWASGGVLRGGAGLLAGLVAAAA